MRLTPFYRNLIRAAVSVGLAFSIDLATAEEIPPEAVISTWCWRSLTPPTGKQNLNRASFDPALAADSAESLWLGWEDDKSNVLRWAKNVGWQAIPLPSRPGTETTRFQSIVSSHSGPSIFVGRQNGANGTSSLNIAQWNGKLFDWMGKPQLSSEEPFTHANEAAIALTLHGEPILAWSEERHVKFAGLFAARWDGAAWHALGTLDIKAKDYYLYPTIAARTIESIWLSWIEDRQALKVARWDGKAWRDLGAQSLQAIADRRGVTGVPSPTLVVTDKGQAWLLWCASKTGRAHSLALAHWDGESWSEVPAPHVAGGKDDTVWSATMILRNGVPLVAWSQADATDNHHFYAAERRESGEWMVLLEDLHLAEGVSNVRAVRLAPGDENSFFAAWDEPGKDGLRTRVIQAYRCTTGESPAAPPKSIIEKDTWPTTVDEAVHRILGELDEESKARVRATKKEDLIMFHHSWGMGIRNGFGLWRGNAKLLESSGASDPDECSMIIIEAVWQALQDPPPSHQKRRKHSK